MSCHVRLRFLVVAVADRHCVVGNPRSEQRFEAALSCREEGKGVKPRQGCSSVQLNRECKEGTCTPEYVKFLHLTASLPARGAHLMRYPSRTQSLTSSLLS